MGFFGLLLLLFPLAALPALAAASLLPASHPRARYVLVLVTFAVLVAPSWGSATIVSVPMPFGLIALLSAVTGELSAIPATLSSWPVWHLISFPLTALVGALIFRRLRPNNSSKPTPLRGAA